MSKIDIQDYIKTFYNFGADIHGDRLTKVQPFIESALKCYELVNEKIKKIDTKCTHGFDGKIVKCPNFDCTSHYTSEKNYLQSLIEESQNTDKEEDKADDES